MGAANCCASDDVTALSSHEDDSPAMTRYPHHIDNHPRHPYQHTNRIGGGGGGSLGNASTSREIASHPIMSHGSVVHHGHVNPPMKSVAPTASSSTNRDPPYLPHTSTNATSSHNNGCLSLTHSLTLLTRRPSASGPSFNNMQSSTTLSRRTGRAESDVLSPFLLGRTNNSFTTANSCVGSVDEDADQGDEVRDGKRCMSSSSCIDAAAVSRTRQQQEEGTITTTATTNTPSTTLLLSSPPNQAAATSLPIPSSVAAAVVSESPDGDQTPPHVAVSLAPPSRIEVPSDQPQDRPTLLPLEDDIPCSPLPCRRDSVSPSQLESPSPLGAFGRAADSLGMYRIDYEGGGDSGGALYQGKQVEHVQTAAAVGYLASRHDEDSPTMTIDDSFDELS